MYLLCTLRILGLKGVSTAGIFASQSIANRSKTIGIERGDTYERPQANKAVGISMWESKIDMLASVESEYLQEQISAPLEGTGRT